MLSIDQLARSIGIAVGYLNNLIFNADRFYRTYSIEKSNKKRRKIDAPSFEIKAIQRWLLKNVLEKEKVHSSATGFIIGKGIKQNAIPHLSKKYILCMDLKDFFNSIKIHHVLQVFSKISNVSQIAPELSKICTYHSYLPQGGVTSPYISNLIFKKHDEEILDYAGENNILYTRYADDLTFSSNVFDHLKDVEKNISKLLKNSPFTINQGKTRYMSGKRKKIITGLIVNSNNVTVGRDKKKFVRSALFNSIVRNNNKLLTNEQIFGLISFIDHIEPGYREKTEIYIRNLKKKFNSNT